MHRHQHPATYDHHDRFDLSTWPATDAWNQSKAPTKGTAAHALFHRPKVLFMRPGTARPLHATVLTELLDAPLRSGPCDQNGDLDGPYVNRTWPNAMVRDQRAPLPLDERGLMLLLLRTGAEKAGSQREMYSICVQSIGAASAAVHHSPKAVGASTP